MRKIIFFAAYLAISISIIVMAFSHNSNIASKVLILAIMFFFGVALEDHFIELSSQVNTDE